MGWWDVRVRVGVSQLKQIENTNKISFALQNKHFLTT